MADRMALGVLNLDSYEISSGKSKEKKFYFHAAPAYSSLKNVNFYVEIESERERLVVHLNLLLMISCFCVCVGQIVIARIMWIVKIFDFLHRMCWHNEITRKCLCLVM